MSGCPDLQLPQGGLRPQRATCAVGCAETCGRQGSRATGEQAGNLRSNEPILALLFADRYRRAKTRDSLPRNSICKKTLRFARGSYVFRAE
jgi:hypothetical protein